MLEQKEFSEIWTFAREHYERLQLYEEEAMPNRPNIVVIVTDQQRSDCIGYANPVLETPYLDDLASQGRKVYAVLYCFAVLPAVACRHDDGDGPMEPWPVGRRRGIRRAGLSGDVGGRVDESRVPYPEHWEVGPVSPPGPLWILQRGAGQHRAWALNRLHDLAARADRRQIRRLGPWTGME